MPKPEQEKDIMRLFAGDMWLVYNYANPNERFQKFLSQGRPSLQRLIESCILYPQIVIPTQDFMVLAVLIDVIGERSVIDMLENNSIRFIRLRGSFAYIGNGGGIKAYEITDKEQKAEPFCAPVDDSIQWALLKNKPKDPAITKLVINSTQEIDAGKISDEIRHETYMDILKSAGLRKTFAIRNKNMDYLAGIEPNGSRIYGGPDGDWKGDEIDIVMLLAATNLELRLSQITDSNDASTINPIGHILKAKAERALGCDAIESFYELKEIAGIPNIGEAVLTKQLDFGQLIKLSKSRNGIQFQEWFHKNCRNDPISTAKEYVSLLKDIPKIQSQGVKILRFLVTTAVGLIPGAGQILGGATGIVDSFFIDRWLRGYSPKYFIDDLNHLMPKKVK